MIHYGKISDACARLSSALLSGKGFLHILQEAGMILNNPLVLVNSRYRVVSSYAPERITDPFLRDVIKAGPILKIILKPCSREMSAFNGTA
jgi:hypothetical protein